MWTDAQMAQYHRQGYLALPGLLDEQQVARLRVYSDRAVERFRGEGPLHGDDDASRVHYVREKSGAVRSLFALHRRVEPYRQVIRLPRIAGPIKQVLDGDAYVYHSKLNVKDAFEGAVWLWHQDYGYWQHDGVDDRIVSVLIMLDRTTLHGGCMVFVPGSHRWGVLPHADDEKTTSYKQWCVTPEALRKRLESDEAFVPVIGEPGDVFFFDCNILHASGHNLAPRSRQLVIYACAHIDNRPHGVENPRPDWVVDREFENVTEHIRLVAAE